ncbi:MAG: hypothetical protein ACTSQK_10160 [Candidatus Heimdallarchaeota archaeon]
MIIDKIGLRVKKGNSTICYIKWHDIKNIRLTSQTEKVYTKKKNYMDFKTRAILSLAHTLDGGRGAAYAARNLVDIDDFNPTRIETTIKTYNSLLISSEKQKDILLNTAGFKLTKKVSFPKELDSLIYILEHFFHKMKRDQLLHETKK